MEPNPRPKKAPLSDRTNFLSNSCSVHKRLHRHCYESETRIGSYTPTPNCGNRSGDLYEPVYCRKKVTEKTKDKEKTSSLPLTIYLEKKTKVKRKLAVAPIGKTKDIRKLIPMTISCTSMVNTRNKAKENVEPLSCSPLPRTRKRRGVSNDGICVSHSYSAPQPNHKKKKSPLLMGEDDSVHDLPREYVEEQRAYFREIDDFELAEEEVSENDSDSEDTSMETLTK